MWSRYPACESNPLFLICPATMTPVNNPQGRLFFILLNIYKRSFGYSRHLFSVFPMYSKDPVQEATEKASASCFSD